ncbi:hypothetical protein CSPX01_09537 [Colletotrichum filicis]|nr:hypothetical protein CSPX01_09537 [Colletotrichum filicis]
MHHTRLLESIKWPKQRSKEGNISHPSRTRHPSPSQPEHRRPPRTLV